jgi:hypothetical protein
VGDRVHHLPLDPRVGPQSQGPGGSPRGRLRAGQGDQPGFAVAVQLPLPARPVLLLADQGGREALLDEPLADPLDRGDVDLDGVCDAGVGPAGAAGGGVGLEQDAGVGLRPGGRLAGGDHAV